MIWNFVRGRLWQDSFYREHAVECSCTQRWSIGVTVVWRSRINLLRKGVDEWQVVRLDGKRRPFEKVSEVKNSGMHCKKFSIKGGLPGFRGESFLLKNVSGC